MLAQLPCDCECSRIRLRRLREDDLCTFHAYRSDAEVGRYQNWALMTETRALSFLREQAALNTHALGSWIQLGIADCDDDRLIGDLGIWRSADRSEAEIGISLERAAQGRGHGSGAMQTAIALLFAHTAVERIHAHADVRNLACLGMLKRAGFRRIDTRQAVYRGETCTEHVHVVERG